MHKETLNPVWNFECDIEIERTYKHVDIEIFDKDPVRSTDGACGDGWCGVVFCRLGV